MSSSLQSAVDQAMWDLAAQKESVLRDAARERLPRSLRWAVKRPRVLRLLYRLRPAWKLTIYYGADLGVIVACARRADGTLVIETFGVGR